MELEATLLRRYAEHRDQAAFGELVRRHLDGVYSSALRRVGGDSHLAEDVTQKVFIDLAQQARPLSRHPAFTGWLYTTTRNHAANTVRTEQRRRAREQTAQLMNEHPSGGACDDAWSRVAPALDWAIDQLPERDRTAVLLRYMSRKPFDEIGETLKISGDAARMRVDRAVEKLRIVLARRGIVSTAALLSGELANHATAAAPAGLSTTVTTAALTAVPATVSTVAFALQLMTTSKPAVCLVGGLLIFAAVGPAIHQTLARQTAEEDLARAESQRERARSELEEMQARLQKLNTETAALEKSLTQAQSVPAALVNEPKTPATRADPLATGKAFLDRHPEVKEAFVAWLKAKENSRWGPLFKSLHLTDAQIEEFRFLIRESYWYGTNLDLETNEYAQFTLSTGLPAGEVRRRQRALLGEQGYHKFLEEETHQPIRNTAAQVAASLIFTESPLTTAQAEQLMAMLDKNRTSDRTGTHFHWDALMTEAAQFLSSSQLTAIEHLRAQDEFQRAVSTAPQPSLPPSAQPSIISSK